jgi:hypothetical protein
MMKKLVLAMVFILLMALFIGFNYLLWDRESKVKELKSMEYDNASNNASINAQTREIKSLEDENGKLQARITELENSQKQLLQNNSQLAGEKDQINQTLVQKIEMINKLKQNTDPKVFEAPIKSWIEAINTGKYSDAYQIEYNSFIKQNNTGNLNDYMNNLKDTIKNMEFKSAKLDVEAGKDTGEVYIDVTFDVKLVENANLEDTRFDNGLNERYFKLDYVPEKDDFIIADITLVP